MIDVFTKSLVRWDATQRVDGILYPANIAWVWSDDELAAIGLYRAKPYDLIPKGKQSGAAVEWDGSAVRYVLEDVPPPERRRVLKATIEQRLIDAGLMDPAYSALSSSGVMFARWYSRISDTVFADDPDALSLLAAIGANAAEIMAP